MSAPAAIRAQLEQRLGELRGRLERIEATLASPVSADFAEQASEREDEEALQGQDTLILHEIAAICGAIDRIDDGTYGDCARCGAPIGEKRLAASPEVALCIECARTVEKQRA